MPTPRPLFITAIVCFVLICGPATSRGGDIQASFNESGDQICTLSEGGVLEVYVVAFELSEISGYEFMLFPTVVPSFFLGKETYGIAPLDFGDQYEVRAGTGGCVASPTMMGPSPDSWTLARFDLGYFSGLPNDTFFCIDASPGSGAARPQYTLCDENATKQPLYPHFTDVSGIMPDGCAVANDIYGVDCRSTPVTDPSWGALKAQFGR